MRSPTSQTVEDRDWAQREDMTIARSEAEPDADEELDARAALSATRAALRV